MTRLGRLTARRWVDLRLRDKGLVIIAIPVTALVLAGTVFLVLGGDLRQARRRVDHSIEVRRQIDAVLRDLLEAESAARGHALAPQEGFLSPYRSAVAATGTDLARLAVLVGDDVAQAERLRRVEGLAAARLAALEQNLTAAEAGSGPTELVAASASSMDAVRQELAGMDGAEAALLAHLSSEEQRLTRWTDVAVIGTIGLGLIGGAVNVLFAAGLARRLERLEANATQLQDELPLEALPPGNDEVGRLGAALARASDLLAERGRSLRETQAFLEHLIAASPVVAVRASLEDRDILYVSSNLERVLGYRCEEAIGTRRFFTELGHPDDLEGMADAALRAVRDGTAENECRLRHRNGDYRWVRAFIRIEHDDDGRPARILTFLSDVTERRHMEEDLSSAHDRALEGSRLKSEFLANMSHEIRTPLNGVIGMTGLLLDTDLTSEQRDFAETARTSGEALLTVINDILDFSKIEAGRMDLEIIDFDLRAIVEETLDLLADQAHGKGLELAALIHPETPLDVRGDPGRLRQILLNLVSNAVKFTGVGEVVVRVGLDPDRADPSVVRFEVADTGIGIGLEDQGRLFQSFSQADASTTRTYGGSGLGLAISKQLAELMGGAIGVRSAPGRGSTFWFTAELGPAIAPIPRFAADVPDLEGLRVLVVDDNATNREILEQTLTTWAMRPTVVDSGAHALAVLRAARDPGDRFTLVLLDYLMPTMDGLALAAAIRADPAVAGPKLVMLTSSGRSLQVEEANQAGIDAFLTKPIRQSALYDALVTVLRRPEAGDQQPLVTAHTVHQDRSRSKAHLLVVEDNPVNQKVAVRMLEKLGYRVDVAASGVEALEAVGLVPYAAVLMDCQMPIMDGYEATAEIRRRQGDGPRTPIIAMTAAAMRGDEERARAVGMDDYVTKPVAIGDLAAALERWVDAGETRPVGGGTNGAEPDPLDPTILASLLELADSGGPGTLDDVVSLFVEDAVEQLDALEAALGRNDAQGLSELAHRLKGSSASLAALPMAGLCADLEKCVGAGDLGAAAGVVARLKREFARVRLALYAAFPGTGDLRPAVAGPRGPQLDRSADAARG